MQTCGTPPGILNSYDCLQTFKTRYRNRIVSNQSLAAAVAEIEDRVERNTERYIFDQNGDFPDTAPLEAYLVRYDECVNGVLPDVDQACEDALQSGEDMCSVCCFEGASCATQAPQCNPDLLIEDATEIIREVPPHDGKYVGGGCTAAGCDYASAFDVHQSDSAPFLRAVGSYTASSTDSICTFSGVKGKFDDNSSKVRLVEASDNYMTKWVGAVSSNNDDGAEKVTGYFHCSPKELFHDANNILTPRMTDPSSNAWLEEELQLNDQVLTTFFDPQLPAIAGFSGNFRGGGEWIQRNRIDAKFVSATQQNQLYAWIQGYGFGGMAKTRLIGTGQDRAEVISISSNEEGKLSETLLMDATFGHCLLEQIGGKFDGRGEEASLEIRPGQNVPSGRAWILRVKAAEGKPVKAAAICLSYLQDSQQP